MVKTKMVIEHEELAELVPHRGKMFIIGRITNASVDDWSIESETKITRDFMFFDKSSDGVPNYACFEIIVSTELCRILFNVLIDHCCCFIYKLFKIH